MSSIFKNLVEYRGIDSSVKEEFKNFRQCNYEWTFEVPYQKPDIQEITIVESSVSIIKESIVKTVVGKSLEGQIATGYKLLISGDIHYKIQYSSVKSVQLLTEVIPFSGFVTIEKNFISTSSVKPYVVIEDVSLNKLTPRCIYSNITLLLVAYTDC